jgi:hypothetical protein
MKNILSTALIISAFMFMSCGSNESKTNETDTTDKSISVPPPDNSAATNPSVGDTVTKKINKDTINPNDTTKRK